MAEDQSWRSAPTGPDPRRPWPAGTFLAVLHEHEWRRMHKAGHRVVVADRELLLAQEDTGTDVFVILDGYVLVSQHRPGQDPVALAIRRRGDVVGEMAGWTGRRRNASVSACGTVTAWAVPYGVFFGNGRGIPPAVARALAEVFAAKLDSSDRWLRDFRVRPGDVCTARVLLELAERFGRDTPAGEREIEPPLTQRDLAAIAGMSLPSVERGLALLRRRGLVRTSEASHTVLDMDRLRRHARSPCRPSP